jgi:hypothetical protein
MSRASSHIGFGGAARAVWVGVFAFLSQLVALEVAFAEEWSTTATLSQSIEIDDNRSLATRSPGSTFESISRATFDTVRVMPASRLGIGGDLSARAIGGAGASGMPTPLDNSIWFKYDTFDKSTKYNFAGSWRRRDSVAAQVEESGLNTVRGDVDTYVLTTGLTRQLSSLDSLQWSTTGQHTDISGPTGTPFIDVTTTTTWTRRVTATSDWFNSAQFELMSADDAANTRTTFVRSTTGLQTRLTRDLMFKSSAGAAWVDTERDATGAISGPVSGVTLASASNVGVVVDAELVWHPIRSTKATLRAFHNIMPNTVGEVERRSRLGFTVAHSLNHSSSLTVSGEIGRSEALDRVLASGIADVFKFSAIYSYKWTPEWQAQIGYKFAHREDDLGSANSNTVMLSVVRRISLAGR